MLIRGVIFEYVRSCCLPKWKKKLPTETAFKFGLQLEAAASLEWSLPSISISRYQQTIRLVQWRLDDFLFLVGPSPDGHNLSSLGQRW